MCFKSPSVMLHYTQTEAKLVLWTITHENNHKKAQTCGFLLYLAYSVTLLRIKWQFVHLLCSVFGFVPVREHAVNLATFLLGNMSISE